MSNEALNEPLWGPPETSRFLGVPTKTLYQWNHRGIGPPAYKIGRHLRYVPAEVRAWVAEQATYEDPLGDK